MDLKTLAELNAERAARRPAFVVTDVDNGGQRLVKASDLAGDPLRNELAKQLRMGKSAMIEVDGGVNAETAKLCVDAGADVLVAGSASFKGGPERYAANIAALKGGG